MPAPREKPEPVEQIRYRARDWVSVAHDLQSRYICDEIPRRMEDFAQHAYAKAGEAINRKGPDFVFGETLTSSDAKMVRESADNKGVKEIKGGTGS